MAWLISVATLLCCAAAAGAGNATGRSTFNPLLVPNLQFPLWDKIRPEHVQPAVKQVIAEETASLELLEQDLTRALTTGNVTFNQVFRPFTQIRLRLDSVYGQFDHLSSVMDSTALRAAVKATAPQRVAFELRLGQSKPIYQAVNLLNNTPIADTFSPEERRLVEITLEDAQDSGVGLPPDKKKRFNDLVDITQKLALNYSNNVLDATKAWKLIIHNKTQLDGVEQTALDVAADKAVEQGFKNATAEDGPWVITPDYATYASIMGFATDRELRRQMYVGYRQLASSGKSDNTPIIRQMLLYREELAHLLGYPNYAVSAMRGKMANLTSATALLEEVNKYSRPAAIREDQELTAFARNATGDPNLKLLWWDISFWSERQKEAKYKIKMEELRQYLPLNNVLQGLFGLVKNLYNVDLEPVANKPPVWQKDVLVYALKDGDTHQLIGYVYMDLFARPGQKESGAWLQPFWDSAHYWRAPSPAALSLPSSTAVFKLAKTNQTASVQWTPSLSQQTSEWLEAAPKQIPLAMLICNQDPPAAGKPSLMTLDQAETVFHEFGHGLQHLLTKASQGLMTGMRNIEWDAVETPSQMQEKWVYDKKTFDSFARHWKTGQPVPQSMFEKIRATVKYRKGNSFASQLVLATTDLILHSTYDPQGKVSPIEVQHEQYRKIMPYPPNPQDAQLNNFGHIFGGGYAAGYYSYMWADVMSTDMFEAFVEAGIDQPDVDHQLGHKFRDTFLASGGAVPAGTVFREFRGRDPKIGPLLAYNGLA